MNSLKNIAKALENTPPASWPADLHAQFYGSAGKTSLKHVSHHGPLYVQKAFYPEGPECAHLYLLHPPGGIVSGDTLDVVITLHDASRVLITTPGATRLYRARLDGENDRPLSQRVINRINATAASYAEWLPCETIIFDGADIDLLTEVQLSGNSYFSGWEITCLGLPASHKPFESGRFSQTFRIVVDGIVKVIDRMRFAADSIYLSASCGFQQQPVCGTMVSGPVFAQKNEDTEAMLFAVREVFDRSAANRCSATIVNGFLLLRYLGPCSSEARWLFVQAWKIIRPFLTGRVAIEPRIWAT